MQSSIGFNECGGVNMEGRAARSGAERRLTHFVLAAAVILLAFVSAPLVMQPAAGRAVDSGALWSVDIRAIDDALARMDMGAAERAWGSAYRDAIAGRSWEGRLAVGDASLRMGEAVGARSAAAARARTNYMAALLLARERGSLDGVLRAAEAFAALGDREAAERGLAIAGRLAAQARDPQAGARVRQARARMAGVEGAL